MARVSKKNAFALDTSSILNQLIEIEQRAKAADAALTNMGKGKNSKSNIAAYVEFADVLQTVTETMGLLQNAMNGKLDTGSFKDLMMLLNNMGGSAQELVDIISELSSFKISNFADAKEATASLRSIGEKLSRTFNNQMFDFELDMKIFDTDNIMAQYQSLMTSVVPTFQKMSHMVADAGWEKLSESISTSQIRKQIKKGSEAVVAQLDKDIENLHGKIEEYNQMLASFVEAKPKKISKGNEQEQLDDLFFQFEDAKSKVPDQPDMNKSKDIKAVIKYWKVGEQLKKTYEAAMQDPLSEEAEYFKNNQKMYEQNMQAFERWYKTKKTLLSKLQNDIKLKVGALRNEIDQKQTEKSQHYEQVVVETKPDTSASDTVKKNIAESNAAFSTAVTAIFNNLAPQIKSEGEDVGNVLYKAIANIFETLKQAGVDVSIENPIDKKTVLADAPRDEKLAAAYYNKNADVLNALAKELSAEYDAYTTMAAEDIAADFGQKVKDLIVQIINNLQDSGFAIGADNGYIEELKQQSKQVQEEFNQLRGKYSPFAANISSNKASVAKLDKALISKFTDPDLGVAENDLMFTLNRYKKYQNNPSDERFKKNTGNFGEHVEEQLILAIKQAYENAVARGMSTQTLTDIEKKFGINIKQIDMDGAEQVIIAERDALLKKIEVDQAESSATEKLLHAKEQELISINQQIQAAKKEQEAAAKLIITEREDAEVAAAAEKATQGPRKRGRPRKNPLPAESAEAVSVVAADETVLREEGDKIVAAINQNTDKVISLLGGKSLLQQLEMVSPATKDFSTANKDAAEAQLKQIYSEPTVAYQKAYDEAQKHGVSQEVLNAYKLNVTKKDYASSSATLQNAQDTAILQTLNTLGAAVKQLADGGQPDNSDDVSRLLEAINAITEQMRVCCDNMSAMQDIKPALEPISQISNTLGEILAKVSALGGGEGTSAVDAQKEALKQNLLDYFNAVKSHDRTYDSNGHISGQETGGNLYRSGKISMFSGEGGHVSREQIFADMLRNIEEDVILQLHTHPFGENSAGLRYADPNFSAADISFGQTVAKAKIPLEGMISGSILSVLDWNNISQSVIKKIGAQYRKGVQALPRQYPDLFGVAPEGKAKGKVGYDGGHSPQKDLQRTKILDSLLTDSIKSAGVNPTSIFKKYNLEDPHDMNRLVELVTTTAQTTQKMLSPLERITNIASVLGIEVPNAATIKKLTDGSMSPTQWLLKNSQKDDISSILNAQSEIFDAANSNPLLTSIMQIENILKSLQQSVSQIQRVIANTDNINKQIISSLQTFKSGTAILDGEIVPGLNLHTKSNFKPGDTSKYTSNDLKNRQTLAHNKLISAENMAIDALNDDSIIDKKYYLVQYFEHLKEFISAAQDNINQIKQVSNLDSEGSRQILSIKQGVQNSLKTGAFDALSAAYYNGMPSTVSFDENTQYGLSSEYCIQMLSSINQSVQEIKRLIYPQYSGSHGVGNQYLDTDEQKNIDETSDMDIHGPMSIKDNSRDSGVNKTTTDYNKLADTDTTNVVYQLLSSKPYATEATLSKVLTKLESGIATNNKAGTTKATEQAQPNSQKGVSLSAVRGTFNRATTIDTRMQRLLAGDSSLKNTDEYAAYEKAKSAMQSKKGKYLDPTDSPQAAASRLNYATQYLATMEQTADALQKVAKRQQALNNLASDPRSTIVPETTVVNAQNMEQELMNAAKITDAVGAKFTLGEKFGEATYEIKDATNHLNKMAIAYDKINKRFIITQKSSKAIDPNASSGSSERDEYGIKSAYTSRFKAHAKLNASLNGLPEIKDTQAYKDYMDAYNQMLTRKKDFFNYAGKTEEEKQELLNIALAAENAQKDIEKLAKTQREFNDIKARGTTMQGTAGLSGTALNTELQSLAKITDVQQANFKMAKDNGQTIKTATYEVKDHTNQVHEMQMAYNSLTGEVVITETRVTQSLSRMQTAIGALQKKLKQVLTYIASYGSIYQIFNIIRQGVTYVKEIDSALTELKKVTNATDAEYEQFLNHMSQTSAVVGSTVKDLTMMSADWARLGYSMEEAGELARSTAVLLNVSEFTDANSATEALISTIQAFGYAADDSMTVVDKLNEVGNNFAVSSDGLATALQTSASSLMAGGNDLNQAVAMIAAGNKVVQDPSVMGAALRTISLRIRGTKTELEELGEDTEGMVTTTSKLQDKIKGLTGVDILDDTGAYKDTYTILVEIGKVWDDLTDQKKAAALELLAGKNRSNALAAILTNVEDLEAAYESALQAEGSANKELETYLNSIQGKLDKFHNAVQTMWNDLISSDFIKFIVSAGTALVNFIDKIGILGTALTALAGVQVVKNFSSITSVLKTLYSQSFATGQSMLALGLAQLKTSLHTRLLNSAFVQTAVTMKIFSQEELATMTVTQLLQAGFKGLWARLQEIGAGLKTFMASNPWMWAVLGAAAAAAALIYFSNSTKRAKEALQDAQDTLSETSSELRELRGELEDTKDRIKELQSMDKLSFTDQEELKNLKRQNNELQRRIDLLQLQEEQEKQIAANKFVDYMDNAASEKTQYDHSGEKPSFLKKWLDSMGGGMEAYATEDENIDTQLAKYQEYQQEIADLERQIINDKKQGLDTSKDEEQLENLRTKVREVSEYMTGKFTEWGESSKGIDYGISDEADKWLDYINNIQDKWAILSGGQSAVSNALTRIFDKDAFAGVSDQIREFADALPDTADEGQELEEYISDLLDKFPKLRETLEELNIPLKDVADYFLYAGDAASESSSEIDNFDKIVQGLNGLKDAYGALKTAITEYNSRGFMSLEALTALLDLSPEYLALLQMENGQLALNKEAMMAMVQAKLAEAEATVVQNAITQIASLSNKAEAQSTTGVKNAAMDAIPALGEYGNVVSTAGQKALVAAGQVDAFMAAIRGAKAAGVDTSAINDVINGMNAQIASIHSLGDNLSNSFNTIMSSGSSGGGGGSSDTLLDWLEHYYDTLENKLAELNAQLESKIDNTTAIKSKNTIVDKITDLYDEKMQKLTNAEATYTARAEKLFKSFSKDIQKKIKNGSLDIQKISDSDLSSDISNYYKYIKAASEARVEMEELQQSIADASKKKFDNITTGYENELGLSQAKIDAYEKQVDLIEERGEQVGTALYSAMMDEQKTRLKSLNKERNELQKVLDNEVKLGHVKVNSDTWYEMVGVINDLDKEIVDTQISIESYQNSINELKWDEFDRLIEKLDYINSQLKFLFDRFTDNDEAFADDGSWTSKGIAALGMLAQQMQLAKNNAEHYREALRQLDQDYKNNLFSEEKYLEKKAVYEEALRDEVESYEDIKDAIVDLNKERIDAIENAMSDELDMYKKLVDKKKELLDAEKELYNFQKGINAKQKNITLLEKQIAALTGSSSAEDITRRIKLQAELDTARQELDDEYYEHSMELTSESLDNEVKYREDQLDRTARDYDEWLKDREQVINTSLHLVQDNAGKVLEQIDLVAKEYGITIADEIRNPWEAGANAIETYRNKFTDDDMNNAIDAFTRALDGLTSKWTETSKAAEDASTSAVEAIQNQAKETIKAQNEIFANYKSTIGNMSYVNTVSGGGSGGVPTYTGKVDPPKPTPTTKPPSTLQNLGPTKKDKYIWITASNPLVSINGVDYIYDQATGHYFKYNTKEDKKKLVTVQGTTQGSKIKIPAGTTAYRKYAKGTLGTSQSAMALIDELGEELVLNAGPNGRLQYLTKGTSVIPADITKKLMDLALDPTEVLERSRPHANANMSVASNIELNLNIAEVVHVEHADADMIPDLANVVKTQMDKYMKGVNNNLKKYVR